MRCRGVEFSWRFGTGCNGRSGYRAWRTVTAYLEVHGGMSMKWLICLVSLFPLWSDAGSLYLCRAYGGGTFWAQAHCNQHNALIERIISVPDTLPFDQQVKLAEQQRQPTTSTNTVTNTTVFSNSPVVSHVAECKALDAQITNYDSMARQPQSGQMQDWITAEKKKARDQQFRIRC